MACASKAWWKVMDSQNRVIISNVYKVMNEKADQKYGKIPLIKAREKTAGATRISERGLTKINKSCVN